MSNKKVQMSIQTQNPNLKIGHLPKPATLLGGLGLGIWSSICIGVLTFEINNLLLRSPLSTTSFFRLLLAFQSPL
jgi:hypothetical protein